MTIAALLGAAVFLTLAALLPDANVKRICFVIGVVCAVVFLVLFLVGVLGYADIREPLLR